MRKHLLLPVLVSFFAPNAFAQVTIPDAWFAAELEAVVPDAMNGNQLDPLHPSVIALDTLDVSESDLSNLSGIEHFTGLVYLNASQTQISTIPPLPSSLTFLAISQTNVQVLTNLPVGLTSLFASYCDIPVVDELPPGLEMLRLDHCPMISFGDLPSSLVSLNISGCDLTEWPAQIEGLAALTDLGTEGNDWSSATIALPPNLQDWWSGASGITSLPPLPASMQQLSLGGNEISAVTSLPPALVMLDITSNPITTPLDPIPATLQVLLMSFTWIPEVGVLPEGLLTLECEYSEALTCLPNLPASLVRAFLSWTIQCIPQPMSAAAAEEALIYEWPIPPLCTNFHVLCAQEPYVEGHTYHDVNGNGVADDGGAMVPLAQMSIEPGGILFGSTIAGSYYCHLQPGSYTATVVPGPYQVTTSGTVGFELPTLSSVVSGSDHGVAFTQEVVDLQVQLVPLSPPVPGFNSTYAIHYQNIGPLASPASIALEFDPLLSFISSTPTPSDAQPGLITWEVSVNGLDVDGLIEVTLLTPVGTALGTEVSLTAVVDADGSDVNPDNDSDHTEEVVIGAFDPNDKRVVPGSLTPAEVLSSTPVRYTVRFQNTGTAPAQLVRVSDTLDLRLDLASFRFLNSSHECAWYIENGVLSVIYEGINLPDSTNDELGSHGYFSFEIDPVNTLLLGESVANVANIYFDYNEPVITAPAVFVVEESTWVDAGPTGSLRQLRVFPNPARDFIEVRTGASGGVLRIHDAMGREVRQTALREGNATLDVRDLPAGVYSVRAVIDQRELISRFVKH